MRALSSSEDVALGAALPPRRRRGAGTSRMTAAKCAGAASEAVACEPGAASLDKAHGIDDNNDIETEAEADDEGAVLGHRDEAESPPGPSAAATRENGRLGAAVPDTGCIPALLMQSLQRV